MAKDEMTQKDKEEEAASGPAGILGGVLSMGASIGGMIPSLLAGGRERDALRRYQQGQGAGASLARRTASEAARRVVGAAGQRGGSGALREGLRAADEITQRGAAQAATTGAREGLVATQMLRQNDLNRRDAFRQLGAGVGQGLAGIGATFAAARDQGPVDRTKGFQADGTVTGQGADETGLGQPIGGSFTGEPRAAFGETIEEGRAGLDRIEEARTGQVLRTSAPTGRFSGPGAITDEFSKAREQGAQQAQEQMTPEDKVREQQTANLQSLADTIAIKQDSAEQYVASQGKPTKAVYSMPPPFNPNQPELLENWIYEEVAKYNPSLGIGKSPQEGLMLLMSNGYEPNYALLNMGAPQ